MCLLIIQIYRYRRVYTQVQRQQTKWVVLGAGAVLLFEIADAVSVVVFPAFSQSASLSGLLVAYASVFIPVLLPLSISLALLRYRLWDVDALINKTLVYALLTALLGTLYAVLIIGLEGLAAAITGTANQPVPLVVSTLAIAALVLPARRRIQRLIDRRFYRQKYDAEKTLEGFSTALRQEVQLEQVRRRLITVVEETMQPTHVSLWLRHPSPQRPLSLEEVR